MRMPRPRVATSTAAVWPKTASQRSRMSVRSRTHPLGASLSRSGRSGAFMAPRHSSGGDAGSKRIDRGRAGRALVTAGRRVARKAARNPDPEAKRP